MTEISTELVKKLRDRTGISIMQCRKALEETAGDIEKAVVLLSQKSAEIAGKKGDRRLGAGTIGAYIHSTGTVGSMIELMCETDFVSSNEEFKKLARDLAMHVAATSPKYLKADELPEGADPTEALLNQPFVKNPDSTITNLIQGAVQKFGENIELTRFVRYSIS